MASDDEETDDSITKQVLNMVLENTAITSYMIIWGVFNVILLVVLLYIAIRISIR
jgi:succinate-acetate transporter protein